jgi:hypothetical protein
MTRQAYFWDTVVAGCLVPAGYAAARLSRWPCTLLSAGYGA